MVAGSIWLVVLNVIWSCRKRPAPVSAPVVTASIPAAQHVAVQPMPYLPSKTMPTPKPVVLAKTEVISCPPGATSGVDSGVEDVPDVVILAEQCQAGKLLIDSNPRSCLSFVPFWSGDLQKCNLMVADGVTVAGNPVSGALGDVALLFSVHLRQYRDRLRLWQCRVEKCREKGHFVEIDGVEVVECSDHLKLRLQAVRTNSNPPAAKQHVDENKPTKVASSKTPMGEPSLGPEDSAPVMPSGKPRRSSLTTSAQKCGDL